MVTPDEVGELAGKKIQTRVNGTVMQSSTLEMMIFSVPQLIEYISSFTPLNPGDVIVTGTPGGVAWVRTRRSLDESGRHCRSGDRPASDY